MSSIFDDPELGRVLFIARLHRVLRQLDGQIETIAADVGIESPPECSTLILSLWKYGPMPLNALAESVGERPAVVGRRIRVLIDQRFARRSVRQEDKRVDFVLTQSGYRQAETLVRLSPLMEEVYRTLNEELGVDLADVIERLAINIKARSLKERFAELAD
ncbi:hypothetical protein [Maricaulis sp.]|uniref:hypothetical protein n=1 Tax=Maricaulis sp. TaxID=1486257 RepID=UPI00260EEA07|nr:hypothetical protein [Maricaulis sp.]